MKLKSILQSFNSVLGLNKSMWNLIIVNKGLVTCIEFTTEAKARAQAVEMSKLKMEYMVVVEK